MMIEDRWRRLMRSIQLPDSMDTFDALRSAYDEKHRHYHTTEHIDDCLARLDESAHLAERPHEVELALWFHDAVYKPMRSDNEQQSADWARDFLIAGAAPEDAIDRVHSGILATMHDASPGGGDAGLLVDIDLSILGRDTDVYDQFERKVRQEYRWVPRPMYRRKRTDILASFLQRDVIYSTPLFRDRYETPARRNLETAIATLRG